MSLLIGNFGKKRNGKTYRCIQYAKNLPVSGCVVNDVNGEKKYFDEKFIQRFYGSHSDYIKLWRRLRNYIIILEEATAFLPHAASNTEIVTEILKARHNGNIVICNFHSLQQWPMYLMNYVDVMIIGKSRGNSSHLSKKFMDYPEIVAAWQRVSFQDPNPQAFEEIWLD